MPDKSNDIQRLRHGIDYRLFVPLLVHVTGIQVVTAIVRVSTSYRALELGLPVIWLGIIAAAFALLPIFIAVHVGRFIDRGHDALALWIGSALMALSCIGFTFVPATAVSLLLINIVLGVGHLMLMASHQVLCLRASSDRSRDLAFGNYTLVAALGQGVGPLLIAWIGAGASIPPTQPLFLAAMLFAIAMLAVSFLLHPAPRTAEAEKGTVATPVLEILRIRGMGPFIAASVITVTAQDLLIIYLPLLGLERNIEAGHIGLMLTVRAAAAVVGRIFFVPLIRALGRTLLTVASMMVGAVAFIGLALPLPLAAIYGCVALIGFGLGISATLSMTSVLSLAPLEARGTVLTMRITGNRIGQVAVPFLAGVVAAATGSAGILAFIGIGLATCGGAVHVVQNKT